MLGRILFLISLWVGFVVVACSVEPKQSSGGAAAPTPKVSPSVKKKPVVSNDDDDDDDDNDDDDNEDDDDDDKSKSPSPSRSPSSSVSPSPSGSPSASATPNVAAAQVLFNTNAGTPMKTTVIVGGINGGATALCATAGCHNAARGTMAILSATDDAVNRTSFFNYVNVPVAAVATCNADKIAGLKAKIAGTAHMGGNRTTQWGADAANTAAKIDTWITGEKTNNTCK